MPRSTPHQWRNTQRDTDDKGEKDQVSQIHSRIICGNKSISQSHYYYGYQCLEKEEVGKNEMYILTISLVTTQVTRKKP